MRLTTVILIASLMQLSAATFGQRISLDRQNTSLKSVLREMTRQSGFGFFYDGKVIGDNQKVDVKLSNLELEEALKRVLSGLKLSYSIDGKIVSIKKAEVPSFFENMVANFRAIDVRGKILDENGQPLVGATVGIKGKNRSVKTDQYGAFYLENVGESDKLVISFIGYQNREVDAASDMGSLTMVVADQGLEEVKINAGYYSLTDKERTGNISKVSSRTISNQPINNPLIALSGNVAGLQITQSNGIPGGGFTVRIRGQNSITSGNDPLYIVDGVNYPSNGISSTSLAGINNILGAGGANPLSLINPSDIESIEILKDADATAIYGSRGANGVILITTKKGNQGATKISTSFSQGFSNVGHRVKLLNTEQYIQMRKESYANDGLPTPTVPSYDNYDLTSYDQNKYTDWQDLFIGGTAALTNASLNITGGSDKTRYIIAGNYTKEGTVLPGNFGFQRGGIRSNINFGGESDRLQGGLTINLSRTESDLLLQPGSLESKILLPPNAPDPLDEFGQLNWADGTVDTNPMAELLNTSNSKTDNIIANLNLSYELVDNLFLKTSLGYNSIKREEYRKTLLASTPPYYGYTSTFRAGYFGDNFNNNFIAEPQISYSLSIGKGKIESLLGSTLQRSNSQLSVIAASNFSSDDLVENIGSAATLKTDQYTFLDYRYFAVFGRLNYNYSGKYFLNLTGRRDGSSRFGPGRQFANFGAIGGAWIISEEKFFQNALPFITFGKVRGSYGITGNDQISDYRYLQLWNSSDTYQGNSTLTPVSSAANTLFAWESNRKLEFGTQLRFLNDRIGLESSWYRNMSSNLLINQFLPLSAGPGSVYVNLPAEVQNSGWEFEAVFDLIKKNEVNWTTGFNLTIPKNKLLSYPELEKSGNSSIYQIGKPLSILKTYNTSVNPQDGAYQLEDKNANGISDDGDRYLTKFLGQYYFGGVKSSLSFRQFSFDILFSFVKQNGRSYLSSTSAPGSYPFGAISNQPIDVLNRWQSEGNQTEIGKFSTDWMNSAMFGTIQQFGNTSVVDASYIRLKNISLGYSLPKQLLRSIKLDNATISLKGQNLFTITKYVGLDPETQGFSLPPLRTVLLGLNISF